MEVPLQNLGTDPQLGHFCAEVDARCNGGRFDTLLMLSSLVALHQHNCNLLLEDLDFSFQVSARR
jgi:hypothetical protein